MTYWRMRMRNGNGGTDRFRQCRANGVAAIHYNPVEDIDLSKFSEEHLPLEWGGLAPGQSGSLRNVAWRMRGGDAIYVAASYPSRTVGVGRIKGLEQEPAYRFLPNVPIVDDDNHPWRYTISVEWEHSFASTCYPDRTLPAATICLNPPGSDGSERSRRPCSQDPRTYAGRVDECIELFAPVDGQHPDRPSFPGNDRETL